MTRRFHVRVHGICARSLAGGESACARRATGEVACWGRNVEGQLGDGGKKPPNERASAGRSVPVAAIGVTDAIDVSTSGDHTCIVSRITIAFGTSLLGVGLDYVEHYYAHFVLTPTVPVLTTMRHVGPSLVLGAVTTIMKRIGDVLGRSTARSAR